MDKGNNMDNWLNEAFESVQNQKRITLNVDLFSRIDQKINIKEAKVMKLPIWKVVVAACLILSVNVFAIKSYISINNNKQANEYHLTTNYNLYPNE